jgi:hypothetical protein
MKNLPEERIPMEGGKGSALLGISLTSISLLVMAILVIFPQTSTENFILSLITATCLMATGATILTLVSDYPLILSTFGIYLLLLSWRLRNLDVAWILGLSILSFALAIVLHLRTPGRRPKGRGGRTDETVAGKQAN